MRQGGAVNGEMKEREGRKKSLLRGRKRRWVKTRNSRTLFLGHLAIKDAINRPSDKFIIRRLLLDGHAAGPPGILTDGRTD